MKNNDSIKLTDFRLAGFLVSRGAKFLGADVNSKGEVVFAFCADDKSGGVSAHTLLTAYPGSAEQQYDAACKTMHDLVKVVLLNKKTMNNG